MAGRLVALIEGFETRIFRRSSAFLNRAALLSISVAAIAGYLLSSWFLKIPQRFSDFVAGLISIGGYNKSGEQLLFLFGIALFITLFFGAALLLPRPNDDTAIPEESPTSAFPYGTFTLSFLLGCWALGMVPDRWQLASWAALVTCAFVAQRFSRTSEDRDRITQSLECAVSGAISPLFLATLLGLGGVRPENSALLPALCIGGAVAGFCLRCSFPRVQRRFALLTCCSPYLLFRLLSFRYEGAPDVFGITGFGAAFILALIFVLTALRYRATLKSPTPPVLTPITLFSLAAFYYFRFPAPSPLQHDEFHLGEMLLPWQQIVELGQRQYFDFVSVQGLLGLMIGFVNEFAFQGTVATFFHAEALIECLAAGVIAALMCRRIGALPTLMLLPVLLPASDRIYLLPIGLLILIEPVLMRLPLRWLLVYGNWAILSVLWNPSSGVAFIAALAPAAVAQGCALCRMETRRQMRFSTWDILAAAALGALLLSSWRPLLGALQFVRENGATNTTAFGTGLFIHDPTPSPFLRHWISDPGQNRIVWECIRVGGWMIGLAFLIRLWAGSRPKLFALTTPASLALQSALLFVLLLFPYAMGRIDTPLALSRTGALSLFALGFLLPVGYLLLAGFPRRVPQAALAGLLLGIPYGISSPSLGAFFQKPFLAPAVGAPFLFNPPEAHEFPALGQGFYDPSRFPFLRSFRDDLGSLLHPRESYFDFTNRSALYYVTGYRCPSPYSATYLAANKAIQSRVIERLEIERPNVAWMWEDIRFDLASAPLRSFRVFRWFIERGYIPFQRASGVYLLSPERAREREEKGERPLSWERFSELMVTRDLGHLPAGWGGSAAKLLPQLSLMPPELAEQTAPSAWTFTVKGDRRAEYLFIDAERTAGKPFRKLRAELLWKLESENEFKESRGIKFQMKPGRLIVPVGMEPGVLLAKEPIQFKLVLRGEKEGAAWKISVAAGSLR